MNSEFSALRCYLVACLLLSPTLSYAECSDAGLSAYRQSGEDAALQAFSNTLKTARCHDDSLLQLNYAQSLKRVSRRSNDPIGLCRAALITGLLAARADLSGPMRALVAEESTQLQGQCDPLGDAVAASGYQGRVQEARLLSQAGHQWLAALEWRLATRMQPDRIEPHRSLCRLLPPQGQQAEADVHCARWHRLMADAAIEVSVMDIDHTRGWLLTGGAAVLLTSAGIAYMFAADAHSSLLDSHQATIAAAEEGNRDDFDRHRDARIGQEDDLRAYQYSGLAMSIAGGLMGAAAIYFWLAETPAQIQASPSGVTVSAQW